MNKTKIHVRIQKTDFSKFNTSNVTSMQWMFQNCQKLTYLNTSRWDMTKVSNTNSMFRETNITLTITIKNINTTDYELMFLDAAINGAAKIVVNYTTSTSSLVDHMIDTKTGTSNVIKGNLVT